VGLGHERPVVTQHCAAPHVWNPRFVNHSASTADSGQSVPVPVLRCRRMQTRCPAQCGFPQCSVTRAGKPAATPSETSDLPHRAPSDRFASLLHDPEPEIGELLRLAEGDALQLDLPGALVAEQADAFAEEHGRHVEHDLIE
jgi:hypothetical protein